MVSKNFTYGRGGRKPSEIIIHHWGVEGQKFENVVRYLETNNRPSSAHAVIQDGKIARIVDYDNTSYHAGNFAVNMRSIGLECRPEATEGDYKAVATEISNIWKKYGIIPLKPHRMYRPTACPGKWDLKKLDRMAREIYNGKPKPKPKPQPSTGKIKEDGYWGSSTTKLAQKKYKTVVDGEVWGQYKPNAHANLTSGWKWSNSVNVKGSTLIKAVQKDLPAYKGKIDGVVGDKFWSAMKSKYKVRSIPAAIKAFQKNLNN